MAEVTFTQETPSFQLLKISRTNRLLGDAHFKNFNKINLSRVFQNHIDKGTSSLHCFRALMGFFNKSHFVITCILLSP